MVLIVRDDAEPRFLALAKHMLWHRKYAKATVEDLWQNSQAAGAWEGSAEDILFWANEADATPEAQQRLLAALQHKRVRFISKVGEDLYKIHGNESEIKKVDQNRELQRLRAQKRWKLERERLSIEPNREDEVDSGFTSDAGGIADGIADGTADGIAAEMPELNQAKPSQAEPGMEEESDGCAATRSGGVISILPEADPPPDPDPPPKPRRPEPHYEPLDLELARRFQEHIAAHNPDAVRIHRANLGAWANDIRLMRESDGRTYQQIGDVMHHATADPFWSIAIQCPAKLRKQWDRLTAEMRRKRKRRGGF